MPGITFKFEYIVVIPEGEQPTLTLPKSWEGDIPAFVVEVEYEMIRRRPGEKTFAHCEAWNTAPAPDEEVLGYLNDSNEDMEHDEDDDGQRSDDRPYTVGASSLRKRRLPSESGGDSNCGYVDHQTDGEESPPVSQLKKRKHRSELATTLANRSGPG